MGRKRSIFDDGFQSYLTDGATFVGDAGIPMLMDLDNTQVPKDLLSFGKVRSCANKRQYIHFYQFDKEFSRVLTATTRYLDDLKVYDGVITPDCSMLIGQSPCLQQANTYMNRAVGFFLQKTVSLLSRIYDGATNQVSNTVSLEYIPVRWFVSVPMAVLIIPALDECLGLGWKRCLISCIRQLFWFTVQCLMIYSVGSKGRSNFTDMPAR